MNISIKAEAQLVFGGSVLTAGSRRRLKASAPGGMRSILGTIAICGSLFASSVGAAQASPPGVPWQTGAKWHRSLNKAVPGTLRLDPEGVEFRSAKLKRRWAYVDIHTFDVSLRELTLLTYESRPWHEPGERPFHFTLAEIMPPEIAAQFSERVGKPVQNGAPVPSAATIAEIPVHYRRWIGGSNGTLRLKDDGIDYVTEGSRDSRSWRWADIQTIASSNPYEFRVTGYREIVEFDLKQPMPGDLFETLWDHLYASGLNLSPSGTQLHLASQEARR